jgi:hypothetical protein
VRGEHVQLSAVVFSPVPTLKPQVVTVKLSHGGLDRMRMSGRSFKGDRFIVHPEVPAIAKLFITVPRHQSLADKSCAGRFPAMGRPDSVDE